MNARSFNLTFFAGTSSLDSGARQVTRLSTNPFLLTVGLGVSALDEAVGIEAREAIYIAAIEIPGGECVPVAEVLR